MSEQAYRAHPMSIVDTGCEIGSGTRIWAGTHVMRGARIGEGCNIGENCFIEGGVVVGSHVTVKNNVALYDGAVVEDDVFLGPPVYLPMWSIRGRLSRANTRFERRSSKRGPASEQTPRSSAGIPLGAMLLWGPAPWSAGMYRTMRWYTAHRPKFMDGCANAAAS